MAEYCPVCGKELVATPAMCHDCPDRPEVVELPGRSMRYGGGGLTTVADEVARLTEGGDDD